MINDSVFLKPFEMTIRIKKAEESLKKRRKRKRSKKYGDQLTRSYDETSFVVAYCKLCVERKCK